MKYLFLSLIFFLTNQLNAQDFNEKMHSITYVFSGKYYNDWESPRKEYTRLLVRNNKAIYQSYNIMCLDSLKIKGLETSNDRNKYFTFNNNTVKISNDTIYYSEVLGANEYRYKEILNLEWQLTPETKEMLGYNCKKATVTYGGRSWTAWYALDIPIPFGPYKFKGLPGLIVKMNDATKDYDFELYGYVSKEKKPLEKLYQVEKDKIIEIDHLKFNFLKYKYNSLTLREKAKFRNSARSGDIEFKQVDADGNEVRFRDNSKISNLNFIELIKL
ncbi:MAG: GLPGLI family protein [Nonlabens sp.]|uniref:GLPGLI family protein n=1 Tax=Nonlabens sp. TaxID=1888209 RepID=UPI003219F922